MTMIDTAETKDVIYLLTILWIRGPLTFCPTESDLWSDRFGDKHTRGSAFNNHHLSCDMDE